MKERFVVCLLRCFGDISLRHVHCLFVWVFVTIYGNNRYLYLWTSYVNLNTAIVIRFVNHLLRASNLYSNVWRLIDYEIDKLNSLYYFLKVYCDSEGTIMHMSLPILLRKIQFYLMFLGLICVLSLALRFICTIYWALMHLLCRVSNYYQSSIWFIWMASIYVCYCWS